MLPKVVYYCFAGVFGRGCRVIAWKCRPLRGRHLHKKRL